MTNEISNMSRKVIKFWFFNFFLSQCYWLVTYQHHPGWVADIIICNDVEAPSTLVCRVAEVHWLGNCQNIPSSSMCRSSRPEVFCKRSVLRIFAKFTGKRQCQTLFLNKVADLRLATLFKMRLWHRCFPVNSAKFLRAPFFQNISGRVRLK